MSQKNVVKVIGSMMAITLIGKILGMLRDVMFASSYGTSSIQANAFLTASRIPRLFFDAMFASAISSSFIPIFNEYLKNKGEKEAYKFSNNFITIVIMVTFILTIVGILFSSSLVGLFATGFDFETNRLCTQLLVILFPMLIFTGVAYCFTGILQSLEEFTIPAIMSIVSNGIIIFYIIFFNDRFGVFGMAVAFLIGWIMQAVIQVPSLIKKGYKYRPRFNIKDEGIKKVGVLMIPVMVSTWIQPINIAVNTRFASKLNGGIAALEYANNLYTIIAGVLILSVSNVIFPKLSRLTLNPDKSEFGETLGITLKSTFFLLIPMMAGLFILSEPIVKVVYQRGEFNELSTQITSIALKFFSLGILGFGMQNILSRGFYAIKDGKTPLLTGIISIIVNFMLSFILVKYMNIGGLALASSISALLSGIMLIVPMQKKLGNIVTKQSCMDIIKMLIAVIAMSTSVMLLYTILSNMLSSTFLNSVIILILPTLLGIIIYMLTSYFIGLNEAKIAIDFVYKILRRRS